MNGMQKKFIEKGQRNIVHLNDFERQFINDMVQKPDSYPLSKKQNTCLNTIHQKLSSLGVT